MQCPPDTVVLALHSVCILQNGELAIFQGSKEGLSPGSQARCQMQTLPLASGFSSLVKVARLQEEGILNQPHLLFS